MTTYARATGAVDAVVDGQVVLLSPADFSYHSLDRVGARVWALLAEPSDTDALVSALVHEFEVSPEHCRTDVEPFLARMTEIGILTAQDD